MDMKYMEMLQHKMFNIKTYINMFYIIEFTKEGGFYYVKILG